MKDNKKPTRGELAGAFALLDGLRSVQDDTEDMAEAETETDAEKVERLTAELCGEVAAKPRAYYAEAALQTACVGWFRKTYPALELLLFHVPNEGRRNVRQGSRWHALGGVAGVADLILLTPRGAVFIEMKAPKGRVSEAQRTWRRAVTIAGYRYFVVRALEDFKAIVIESLRVAD